MCNNEHEFGVNRQVHIRDDSPGVFVARFLLGLQATLTLSSKAVGLPAVADSCPSCRNMSLAGQ